MRSKTMTIYSNLVNSKIRPFNICKETFMTVPVVLYSLKDFYLLDAMTEKIEICKAAGLVEYWNMQHMNRKILRTDSSQHPKILELDHLLGCFQILLLGNVIGFLVFCFEVVITAVESFDKFKKRRQHMNIL